MNGLHILFCIVVGAFLSAALSTGNLQLIFGAVGLVVLAVAMRIQGRLQMAQEIKRMAEERMAEEDE